MTLDGALIRINPDTGAASAGNPLAGSADENARRIISYGFRNPYRLTKDPATGDLYVGDVGNVRWEEINRIVPPSGQGGSVHNYGWPCYEGGIDGNSVPVSFKGVPWETMGNNLCDDLYAEGAGAVDSPAVRLLPRRGATIRAASSGGSNASISGLAFYEAANADQVAYPPRYDGALFFVDYSRNCLAMLRPDANGVPDPIDDRGHRERDRTPRRPRDRTPRRPVLPGLRRRPGRADPVRALAGGPRDGDAAGGRGAGHGDARRLVVHRSGPRGEPRRLGLGPGPRRDVQRRRPTSPARPSSGRSPRRRVYPITLRVTSSNGFSDTAELSVDTSNDPPVPHIDTPAATRSTGRSAT